VTTRSDHPKSLSPAELRHLAEEVLSGRAPVPSAEDVDLPRLLHELLVHRVELELQNEELIRTHAELEESARRFRELYERAPAAYFTLDPAGTILEANPASEALLRVPCGALIGEPLARFIASDPAPELARCVAAAMDSDALQSCETRLIAGRDGEPVEIHFECCGHSGPDGGRVGYCVLRDITAERREALRSRSAQEAAELANRAKSEFLARMSHELRTPMSSIYLATELALAQAVEGPNRTYLTIAHRAASALLDVVSGLLDLAKIEAGREDLVEADFDLRATIAGNHAILRMSAEVKGLTYTVEIDPRLPHVVHGDRGRLGQVLLNLLANAIKFTERGGIALIARVAEEPSRRGGVALVVEVKDTGMGFPAAVSAEIFEPFTQAIDAQHLKYGGSGLGLAISRQLVGLMGGRIWCASEVDVGSTFGFIIDLGAAKQPEALEGASASPPRALAERRRRVLVVDDDLVSQHLAAALLRRAGHEVLVADDGLLALQTLARRPVDVLLLDRHMPALDGLEMTRRIRAGHAAGALADLLIIGLTAVAFPGDREACLDAGMDACLIKPLDLAEFDKLVDGRARSL
jgi:two-component system CheB/CheR fusion protein